MLATSHGIVKQAGGQITVDSEPDMGTIFRIYLPRVADTAAVVAQSVAAVPSGNEHVVVVEDDPAVRRVAVRMLTGAGYTVTAAADAESGLKLISPAKDRPHLLFTDVVLSGMGGREFAEAARRIRPDLKVLFTTGYTDDVVFKRQLLDHNVVVLPKPYTAAQLARKVREVLDGTPPSPTPAQP